MTSTPMLLRKLYEKQVITESTEIAAIETPTSTDSVAKLPVALATTSTGTIPKQRTTNTAGHALTAERTIVKKFTYYADSIENNSGNESAALAATDQPSSMAPTDAIQENADANDEPAHTYISLENLDINPIPKPERTFTAAAKQQKSNKNYTMVYPRKITEQLLANNKYYVNAKPKQSGDPHASNAQTDRSAYSAAELRVLQGAADGAIAAAVATAKVEPLPAPPVEPTYTNVLATIDAITDDPVRPACPLPAVAYEMVGNEVPPNRTAPSEYQYCFEPQAPVPRVPRSFWKFCCGNRFLFFACLLFFLMVYSMGFVIGRFSCRSF